MQGTMSGAQIRALRERHGLSQVEFAKLLGVSNVTVNRWEHDRVAPQPGMLERLQSAERDGLDPRRLPLLDVPGNLPAAFASIIGREADLAAIAAQIHDRLLVTITGPGGVGKTRLALEVARVVARQFATVWFIDLAAVADGDAVVHTMARVLGLRETSRDALLAALTESAQRQPILLVLDNCEHVRDAAADVARVILGCGGASRVLATSRIPLGVTGEYLFQLHTLAEIDAVALFTERAGQSRQPDRGALETIAGLCRRLDQLPLAIELAAARTQVLSISQIAERIDRRFELLRRGGSGSGRWHALDATIAWSYDLLTPKAARLFRALSVFAGSFDLAAIEAILDGDAIDALDELANQSMIVIEQAPDSETARYRLLFSLADFARQQLETAGEAATIAARHASYFESFGSDAARQLRTTAYPVALARLHREHENIIAAMEHASRAGEPAQFLELVSSMLRFWYSTSLFAEAQTWIDRAVDLSENERSPARVHMLYASGVAALYTARLDDAQLAIDRALALAREIDDQWGAGETLDLQGTVANRRGDLEAARSAYEAARDIRETAGDTIGLATTLLNLGVNASNRMSLAEARECFFRGWTLAHAAGDLTVEGLLLANLSELSMQTGELARGLDYNQQAAAIFRVLNDRDRLAYTESNMAMFKILLGDFAGAVDDARAALAHHRVTRNPMQLGPSLYTYGVALAGVGSLAESLAQFRELGQREFSAGHIANLIGAIEAIARLHADAGDPSLAARLLGGAAHLRADTGPPTSWPFDYEGTLRSARAKLTTMAFEAAWQEGSRSSADGLLVEALNLGELRNGQPSILLKPAVSRPAGIELTQRQIDVLKLVAAGRSNREIGDELAISTRTVERHLSMIFNLFGVDRRSAAIAAAAERGLL